ncbi:primosomal protein N' [Gynuella sp.]|uniref:primosomal protein N' n=1 Tax=Gynuella sp. TaxID=2969146 RepID=UPI003D0A7033
MPPLRNQRSTALVYIGLPTALRLYSLAQPVYSPILGARIIPESITDTTEKPPPQACFVEVALALPMRQTFTYRLPSSSQPEAQLVGCRVRVPFGSRTQTGLITQITTTPAQQALDKIKPVSEVLDQSPLLDPAVHSLCQWAAQYYQHSLGEALMLALPTTLRKGQPAHRSMQKYWLCTHKGRTVSPSQLQKRSPKQAELLALLQELGALSTAELKASSFSPAILKGLESKQLVELSEQLPELTTTTTKAIPGHVLNEQQQQAVNTIHQSLGNFAALVLEGVTGSGKTEVYIAAIQQALDQGQQALLLVPEIGLTPQTVERVRRSVNQPVAILHSGLSDKERLDTWLDAQSGRARVVIGTRSAVFTSMPELGLIIVDEEHDSSFKQQDGFRYHARDLAVKRAQLQNLPVILGSATPSLETLNNLDNKRYQHLSLSVRAGNAVRPDIQLIDLRKENVDGGISESLLLRMRQHLENGHQVLLFLNRRGYAPTLMCEQCGWIANCDHCDAHMTLHRQPARLLCHHCNHQQPIPHICPSCQSRQLQPLGLGTARTEERLQQLFANTPVVRIDRDSTSQKNSFETKLEQIHNSDAMILIGTQMLAKGHHLPKVTLVAVLDADAGLFASDFRAAEKMAQMLTQVAGRAGRAELPGQVLIQTWHPQHPLFESLLLGGYGYYAREQLLPQRQLAGLPPFQPMAMIRADSRKEEHAQIFLAKVSQYLGSFLHITGPLPAPLSRRAGMFRFWLTVQHPSRRQLQHYLNCLAEVIEQQRWASGISWGIDVDPHDLS